MGKSWLDMISPSRNDYDGGRLYDSPGVYDLSSLRTDNLIGQGPLLYNVSTDLLDGGPTINSNLVVKKVLEKLGEPLSDRDLDGIANLVTKPAFGKGIMQDPTVQSNLSLQNSLINRVLKKQKLNHAEYTTLREKNQTDLNTAEKVKKSMYDRFFVDTLNIKEATDIETQLLRRASIDPEIKNTSTLPEWATTKNFLKNAFLAAAFGITVFCIDKSISSERKRDRCMRDCVPAFRNQFAFHPSSSSGDHLHYWALDTTQHWRALATEYEGAALCTYANLTKLREDGEIAGLNELQLPEKSDGQLYSATCDDFCHLSCGQFKQTLGECTGKQLRSATETVLDVAVPVTEAVLEAAGEITEEVGTTISDFLTQVMDGTGWVLFGVLAVLMLLVFT
jgi:hypothetical protein